MVSVQIREADFNDPFDAKGILGVLNSYAADPVGGGKPLLPDAQSRLIPALKNQLNSLVFLALAGDRPVGLAVCFFGLSTFQARPLLNVHDLAVIPEYRGKGIGRALLAAAEERAIDGGCCKLTLEVQEENLIARSLYGSFGFADFIVGDSGPTRFLNKPLS